MHALDISHHLLAARSKEIGKPLLGFVGARDSDCKQYVV